MDELKICFVWVRSFRNFENAGINLSSSHKFNFNTETKSLTFKKTSKLPKDFFGKRITEVTALIGKNGSGKSNALELICKLLKEGNTTITKDFLVITEDNTEFKCHHNFIDSTFTINQNIKLLDYAGAIDPLKIVYFSNVYDQRINNFSKDVSDISGNKRLAKRFHYTSRDKKTDFEYQVNFINSPFFEELSVPPPERILITSNVWTKRFNSAQREQVFGEYLGAFHSFESDFRKRLRGVKEQSRLYYLIVFAFFKEAISNFRFIDLNKNANKLLESFFNKVYDFEIRSTSSVVDEMLIWLHNLSNDFNNIQIITRRNEASRYRDQLELLNDLKDVIYDLDIKFETEGQRGKLTELFSFDFYSKRGRRMLKSLSIIESSLYFNVDWLGISSGHKAYLNLFSLVYAEVRRIKKNNLLLCIDEGDLYLHPKWQIEFFSKLLNVLPKIYDGNIQLILTSHSPFLLSDIPKQCLTILDKELASYTMDGVDLEKETFAGNIYDLYEAPFFLGNQKKSVFSTQKIRQILDSLDQKDATFKNDDIDKLINLIGDDVIRFHLKKRRQND